jgi:divalent metal cation (Fe/Co/Zn/Cd) transporter
MRVAKATRSQALEADALHFSSDILSSSVVLLGLVMVYFGFGRADAVAALGVAVFVCRAGYQLGRRTLDILIDTAPEGVAERVEALALKVPGIAEVERVRVRPAGRTIFIEILASVGRTLPLARVQEASREAAKRVRGEYPDADIVVHTQPLALDNETIADRVKWIAANQGLSAFRVAVQRVGEQLYVTFDLEVPAHQSIRDAHDVATGLENAVRNELGEDVVIDSHISPLLSDRTVETTLEDAPDVVATIEQEGHATPYLVDVHNIQIRRSATGRYISFHCRFQDDTPLEQVEGAVRQLEHRLYDRIPGARRVVAHAEPIWHED